MIELRHQRSYARQLAPDGTVAAVSATWQRTTLCLGGLRLGVLPLADTQHGFRATARWRWSWRGVEASLGRVKLWAGWLAPPFRLEN